MHHLPGCAYSQIKIRKIGADFSDFYLAVSASVNNANYRRPNSFITPMTRDMTEICSQHKNGKIFVADFSDFYLAVSASVMGVINEFGLR